MKMRVVYVRVATSMSTFECNRIFLKLISRLVPPPGYQEVGGPAGAPHHGPAQPGPGPAGRAERREEGQGLPAAVPAPQVQHLRPQSQVPGRKCGL